ncbi:hypothetical protein [Nocardia sp. CA-135398]|uniref:hypothetical protein n=1 Tax=Nocardia sp. CA-135398 TaxID=3239977 RepID=UPI003D95238E
MTTTGNYLGATAHELRANTRADKAAGAISQKALFRRRGTIELGPDTLTLTAWSETGELRLHRNDITSIDRTYTDLYGRFLGGLLDSGKPLILDTLPGGEIYLLIDRREIMESTRNKQWENAIRRWLDTRN